MPVYCCQRNANAKQFTACFDNVIDAKRQSVLAHFTFDLLIIHHLCDENEFWMHFCCYFDRNRRLRSTYHFHYFPGKSWQILAARCLVICFTLASAWRFGLLTLVFKYDDHVNWQFVRSFSQFVHANISSLALIRNAVYLIPVRFVCIVLT